MANTSTSAHNGKGKEKATVEPIPLYSLSSQYRNWRYSNKQLEQIRTELNVRAVERVRSMVQEERDVSSTKPSGAASTSTSSASTPAADPTSGTDSPTPAPSEIQYLTVQDELSLVTYYLTQFGALCQHFQFPEMVQATAMTYLKRFYLRNTCMDYHPKNVMLTCVFLATKTENHSVTIDSFSSNTRTTPEDILSLEFLVSQSLRFEYKVHHAHIGLQGLFLDFQTTDSDIDEIKAAYSAATKLVALSRLTDVEFIYTPSQIALACFHLASPSLVKTWINGKAEPSKLEEGEEDRKNERLFKILGEISEIIQNVKENPVDKGAVTEVDKRLKWARNPEKNPQSALYKKRKAAEEAEREAKSKAKAAMRPPEGIEDDVFD